MAAVIMRTKSTASHTAPQNETPAMVRFNIDRRQFLRRGAVAAAGICWTACQSPSVTRRTSPHERLNIGVIGVANRGAANLQGVAKENIVALCDVNDNVLAEAARKFPQAKTYSDFRRLLEQKDLEAVVVSTPDHVHAVAAVMALKRGLHV